jgi:tRNA-2-methylthio-N6-dimethylallyladenosine synthase
LVTCTITSAAPYHLMADDEGGSQYSLRRTIAGDAWDRAEAESCAVPEKKPGRLSLDITVKNSH